MARYLEKVWGSSVFALCLLVLVNQLPVHVEGAKCTARFKLELEYVNSSFTDAQCQDGSTPGFYIGGFDPLNIQNKSFIIWLGDTQVCSDNTTCDKICDGTGRAGGPGVCEDAGVSTDNVFGSTSDVEDVEEIGIDTARCLYSRVVCTSDWWNDFEEVTPGSVLCQDLTFYADYIRVYAPACSLDYWLGQGDTTDPTSSRFHGADNFRAIIKTLIFKYGLGFAAQIVIGGTRGAGLGAIHLQDVAESILNNNNDVPGDPTQNASIDRQLLSVVDSSWFLNFEEFAPSDAEKNSADGVFSIENHFRVNTSNWIGNAELIPSCRAKWIGTNQLYKCLFLSELLSNHLAATTRRVMVMQSQYDVVQLFELGLTDTDAINEFGDDTSFAQGSIGYVENFGLAVRQSLQTSADLLASNNIFFYSTVCAQHGYIVPTQLHSLDPRVEPIGDAGSIQFQRNEEVWENINSESVVLFTALQTFISTNGTEMVTGEPARKFLGDTCGKFLCNSACATEILPFQVSSILGPCLDQVILVYAIVTILIFLIAYCTAYYQLRAWKKVTASYWKRINIIENLELMKFDQDFQESLKGELLKGASAQLKKMQYENKRTVAEVEEQLIIESNTGEYREVHLMVEDLSYSAPPRHTSWFSFARKKKFFQVLDNISIGYDPGKVHALMGPSGSGKSTLLDILSLTRATGKMKGTHYINGVPSHTQDGKFITEWFKHNSSYVSQTDVLFPHLTVREHLEHAAWLMLPEYMPEDAKLRRVWQFLRLLDLSSSANVLCGDGGVTVQGGLSGGQRRRVTVATALLRNPCVLFLDEPTSGLDSYSALSLVERMHNLAEKTSVNVMMTIHQPRKEIFKFIDDVTILVRGRICYFGPTANSIDFFNLPRATANIGNDIIDKLKDITDDDLQQLINQYESSPEGQLNQKLMQAEKTTLTPDVAEQLREVLVFNSLAEGRWSWTAAGSAPWLQWVLIARTLKRGGFDIVLTMAYSLLGGLFLGTIFLGTSSYRSRVALLYLTVACITFFQGIFLSNRYFDEKRMFDYEKKSGTMKSASAFIASQFTRDCVAACAETLIFIIPLIPFGGLSLEPIRLLNFVVLCLLVAYTTTCLNVLIETQIDNMERAAIAQVFVLGIGALFNGFIINLSDLPFWLSWLPYIMLSFWGFVGVLINELGKFSLPCDINTFSVLECTLRTGDIVIRGLNYDDFDVTLCMAVLILMIFAFRIAAFLNFYYKYALLDKIKRSDAKGGLARTFSSGSFGSVRRTKERDLEEEGEELARGITITKVLGSTAANFRETKETRKKSKEELRIQPKTFLIEGEEEFDEEEDDDYSDFSDEDDFAQESVFKKILLSRGFLTGFFILDVYSAAYLCAFVGDLQVIFIAIAGTFFFVYFVQFLYQVWALIPYTVDGTGRDFVWASEYDFPALITLIIDSCLFILQFTVSDSFQVRIILALALRTARGVRVLFYWLKVDKQHRVTANSFLEFKQAEIDAIIEKEMGRGGELGANIIKRRSRQSLRMQRTSAGRLDMMGRMSAKFNREALKKALAATGTTAAGNTNSFGEAPPRPPRPSPRQIERSRQKPTRPARPGTGIGNRLSARLSPSGRSPTRPERPRMSTSQVSQRRTNKAASGASAQWKKFRNPQTGKTIYYNPFTGEVLEGEIATMQGASPTNQPGLDEV